MTTIVRTLTLLRRSGWLCAVVERWIPGANVRSDLWHFGDVLAVHARDRAFLIVQTTTADHLASRLKKAQARPELETWLQAGGLFEVHGWAKVKGQWHVKRVAVRAEDLQPVLTVPLPRRRRGRRFVQQNLFVAEADKPDPRL